jgi:hypothetical protein
MYTLIQPYSTQLNTIPKTMDVNNLIRPETQGKIIFFAILGTFSVFFLIIVIALISLITYCIDTVLPNAVSVLKPLIGTFLRAAWSAAWNVKIPLPLSLLPCGLMLIGLWYFGLLA